MPVLARLVRLSRRGERGAAALEYAGAFALVAVLVGGTAASAQAGTPAFGQIVATAICRVTTAVGFANGCAGLGGTSPNAPPTTPPFDPKPKKCRISERTDKVSAEVDVFFVKFGENAGFIERHFSDKTVTITATDGATVGAEGEVGAKLEVGKLEAGAKVAYGGGVNFDYGSTWTFADRDEAEAAKKQLFTYIGEQRALEEYPDLQIAYHLRGGTPPPKPPTQTVRSFEVEGEGGGKLGLSLPFKVDPEAESGIPNVKLAETGFKFGGSRKWTQITDNQTGNTTYTTGGEYANERSGAVLGGGLDQKKVLGSSLAVTRDRNNKIVSITLVTTREGKLTTAFKPGYSDVTGTVSDSEASVTVTTTSVSPKTPEQQVVADQWLAAQSILPDLFVSDATAYPDQLVPGDAFQNLAFTNGTVSNVQYDNVTDKLGFAAEIKAGVGFGVDIGAETTTSTAADATYLDGAGSDNVRRPVDFPECEAR